MSDSDLTPATYSVQVVLAVVEGHELIERLRIVDDQGGPTSRGERLGAVEVEFAQLGLCDRQAAEAAFAQLDEQGLNSFGSQLSLPGLTGAATFPDGTEAIFVEPEARS